MAGFECHRRSGVMLLGLSRGWCGWAGPAGWLAGCSRSALIAAVAARGSAGWSRSAGGDFSRWRLDAPAGEREPSGDVEQSVSMPTSAWLPLCRPGGHADLGLKLPAVCAVRGDRGRHDRAGVTRLLSVIVNREELAMDGLSAGRVLGPLAPYAAGFVVELVGRWVIGRGR